MSSAETAAARLSTRARSTLAQIAWHSRALLGHAGRFSLARRDTLLLMGLGILARGLTAALIHHPGYIDAAYYYAVARNVAAGRGLTEDFIITYLVPAAHVVHPSNLYWMPGASLVLVPFLLLFGGAWWAALLPNVLLTGTLPALAYAVGHELVGTRRAALGAGLLTLTSGFYYALYDPLPDNFGLYAWVAGGALLLMSQGTRGRPGRFALAGLCCGLAHLARAEAPLLLVVAATVWWWTRRPGLPPSTPAPAGEQGARCSAPRRGGAREGVSPLPAWSLAALVALYLLAMAPWFARNLLLVGAPLPPGGFQTAWLRSYNDFFSYGLSPTPASYFAWGLLPIVGSKLSALGSNALELAAVMEFVLAPLALLGAWRLRRSGAALPWLLYAVGAYLALSLVFTFPGANGGVLHTEVAALPFFNVAAVVGLDGAIDWLGRASKAAAARAAERKWVYLGMAIALSVLLSAFLVLANAHDWDASAAIYARAGRVVAADAGTHAIPGRASGVAGGGQAVVMVEDPSFYYVVTGQRAIVIPDQGPATMLAAARRYGARYLVLEPLHSPAQNGLWSGAERPPLLTLLYSGPGLKVYRWSW
jgi:hypothetical protein